MWKIWQVFNLLLMIQTEKAFENNVAKGENAG